jgi:hypothetical protein
VAAALLPIGACLAATHCRWLPAFFIYGCLGSLAFVPLALPDNRAYLGPGRGPEPFEIILFAVLIVLAGGMLCRVVAWASHDKVDGGPRVELSKCEHCGYLLYGLTEPRCPECGEPFDWSLLRRKPIDHANAAALERMANSSDREDIAPDDDA